MGMICGSLVLIIGILGFVAIRIYTHSVLLEVLILFFGPTGVVSIFLWLYLRKAIRKINAVSAGMENPGRGIAERH
jgi:uncharacterized membrane protein HdeD (DUF308 family)